MGLCNVETCSNKSGMPGVRTVSFPKDPKLRSRWIAAIANRTQDLSLVRFPRICSAHFPSTCWDNLQKPPTLLAGSVPSIFCRCPFKTSPKRIRLQDHNYCATQQPNLSQREILKNEGKGNNVGTSLNSKGGRKKRTDKITHSHECPFNPTRLSAVTIPHKVPKQKVGPPNSSH